MLKRISCVFSHCLRWVSLRSTFAWQYFYTMSDGCIITSCLDLASSRYSTDGINLEALVAFCKIKYELTKISSNHCGWHIGYGWICKRACVLCDVDSLFLIFSHTTLHYSLKKLVDMMLKIHHDIKSAL